jgi:putative sterol carrier protein
MADTSEAFFAELDQSSHTPLLAKSTGSMRIDLVDGPTTDSWLIAVDRGDVRVTRELAAADAVVTADRDFFDRMVAGEANAMAAVIRGEITVDGDLELVMQLQRLFPGPPTTQPQLAAKVAEARP